MRIHYFVKNKTVQQNSHYFQLIWKLKKSDKCIYQHFKFYFLSLVIALYTSRYSIKIYSSNCGQYLYDGIRPILVQQALVKIQLQTSNVGHNYQY